MVQLFVSVWGATPGNDVDVLQVPDGISLNTTVISSSWGRLTFAGNKITLQNLPANTDTNQHPAVGFFIYFAH